ncbi:MAG: hypothetical protein KAS69_01195 [Planctomycetes bacterium]|nr:hypothetical protein [Planctomycetota bacterium]
MTGWRSKLVFMLIIYFAGFATAIYFLAPAPDGQAIDSNGIMASAFKTDAFAQSFNVNMHKCLDFSKDAAQNAGKFIQQKFQEKDI